MAVACVCVSCGDDGSGNEDTEGSTGTPDPTTGPPPPPPTTGPADSSDGGFVCEDECLVLPEGFSGPATLVIGNAGDTLLDCEAPYDTEFFNLGVDLLPPTGQCLCDCASPQQLACEPATLQAHTMQDCSDAAVAAEPATAGCGQLPPGLPLGTYDFLPAQVTALCEPSTTAMLDEPAFEQQVRVCGVSSLPVCEGGLCAPPVPPSFGRMCVYTQQAIPCPAEYPEEIVALDLIVDERMCLPENCGCGVDSDPCDTSVWFTDDCVSDPMQTPVEDCPQITAPTLVNVETTLPPVAEVSCVPDAKSVPPVGGLVPMTGVVFCCQPG